MEAQNKEQQVKGQRTETRTEYLNRKKEEKRRLYRAGLKAMEMWKIEEEKFKEKSREMAEYEAIFSGKEVEKKIIKTQKIELTEQEKAKQEEEAKRKEEAYLGKNENPNSTYGYSNFLLAYLMLGPNDKKFKYEINYLCVGNPKIRDNEGFKTYYCKPVSIIVKEISRINEGDVKIEVVKYDIIQSLEDIGHKWITISESKGKEKFKEKPIRPFWLNVKIEEKTYEGKKFYDIKIDQNINKTTEQKVEEIETEMKRTITVTDEETDLL
jgi:hypothetical protein